MIEVVPASNIENKGPKASGLKKSGSAQWMTDDGTFVSPAESELLAQATDFFANRLLTRRQQARLTFLIELTTAPIRVPISLENLTGKLGFFGFKPPRLFEMTASTALGMRAALEFVAGEMVHVAQVSRHRLEIFSKKHGIIGARKMALKAKWRGKRESFVDAQPRHECIWVIEAEQTATQLVDEFLAWSAGHMKTVPRQRETARQIGLYRVRPAKIELEKNHADKIHAEKRMAEKSMADIKADIIAGIPADVAAAVDAEMDRVASVMPDVMPDVMPAGPVDLPKGPEFVIYVDVPALGAARQLTSGAFYGKVNDLLERGLIVRGSAGTAIRLAEGRRQHQIETI